MELITLNYKEAIKMLFPQSLHQLCIVHLKRNLYRNLSKEDYIVFKQELEMIFLLTNYTEAVDKFQSLCDRFSTKYPSFMDSLKKDVLLYFQFIRLPIDTRKHLKTTNLVEGINNLIQKLQNDCGGYFRSQNHLKVLFMIQYHSFYLHNFSIDIPLTSFHKSDSVKAVNGLLMLFIGYVPPF
ncbi:MAG: transposase [Candidatus Hydrogenedentota bacterium]